MGAKPFVRTAEPAVRRTERAALRRHRALTAELQRRSERSLPPSPADEVRRFDNYVALLTSVHVDCAPARDWTALVTVPPPPEPVWVESESREAIARAALASYRPGLLERLLGTHTGVLARLETAVHEARAADCDERERALAAYREQHEAWSARRRHAQTMLRLDPITCQAALEQSEAFDELGSLGAAVTLTAVEQAHARLIHRIENRYVVPRVEVALAANGQLTALAMAASRQAELFKEHVCSCVLRIAREVFAALPVAAVSVHTELSQRDTRGLQILDVQFERATFSRLNFDAIQPSATIASFPHRTSFQDAGDLALVEPPHGTTERAEPAPGTARDVRSSRSPQGSAEHRADGTDRAAVDSPKIADTLREANPDLELQFCAWLAAQIEDRASGPLQVKTLVNQLGRFRAERRLSFKAVQDLAGVLSAAGYETEPDLQVMTRSPGIEARVRVRRRLSAEQRRAKAFRDAAPSVALLQFLWGAGYRRLRLSIAERPRGDDPAVETTQELVEHVRRARDAGLAVLEHLIITGALERWLLAAQDNAVLATLASGLRRNEQADKATRWLAEAMQDIGSRRARH